MNSSDESAHKLAAEAFVQAARDRFDEDLEAIHLFGSVARGEERGVDSDVNLLVVLSDETDDSRVTDAIRDLAYEVELEYGIVLSLVVRTQSELDRDRHRPFVRMVTRTGQTLYG